LGYSLSGRGVCLLRGKCFIMGKLNEVSAISI
jgi:hypothetical protein